MAFTYMSTQILGHYGSEPFHTKELVEFVKQGKLNLSKSVSEVLPLDQAALALEKLEKKIGNPIRIVLIPNSSLL
jgi:threonine dehydrogenase-like Zn-dependent dehydrogenase